MPRSAVTVTVARAVPVLAADGVPPILPEDVLMESPEGKPVAEYL